MFCSLPGSSIHGIFQARVLEWVAISFSRGSSQPRDRTQVSHIAGRCFNLCTTRSSQILCFKTNLNNTFGHSYRSSARFVCLVVGGTRKQSNLGLSSVQFSRSVVSDSLRPHESQHTRPPCPSPTPGVHSNSPNPK